LKQKKSFSDLEFKVLENIEENPKLTQRQLAKDLDVSLGKINYVIRALLDIGLVKVDNFRKSDNKIGYMYILTPKGIAEKTLITQHFLQRKVDEYARLKKEIDALKKSKRL